MELRDGYSKRYQTANPLTMEEAEKLAEAVRAAHPTWMVSTCLCESHTNAHDKPNQPHVVDVVVRVRREVAGFAVQDGIKQEIKQLAASPDVLDRPIADASITLRTIPLPPSDRSQGSRTR